MEKRDKEKTEKGKMYEPKQKGNHATETTESAGADLNSSNAVEYSTMREEEGKSGIPVLLVRRMSSLRAKFDQVKARREDLRRAQELSQQTLRQSIQAKQARAAEARKTLSILERERKRTLAGSAPSPTGDNARSLLFGVNPDPATCKRLCDLFSRLEVMKRQAEHEKRHIVASWKRKKASSCCDRFDHATGSCSGRQNEVKELLECAANCIQNAWIYRRTGRIYCELLIEMSLLLVLLEKDVREENVDQAITVLAANRKLPTKMQHFLSRLNWPFLESGKVSLEDAKIFIMAFYHIITSECETASASQAHAREIHSSGSLLLDEPAYLCSQCSTITLDQAARSLVRTFLHFDFTLKSCSRLFLFFQIFKERFRIWQMRDKASLVQELQEFNQELEELRESVNSQVDYEDVWKARIDSQQERVDKKIKQLESNSISLSEPSESDKVEAISQPATQNRANELAVKPGTESKAFNSSAFLFGTFSKQELIHEIFMTTNFRMENFLIQKFNQHSETCFSSFDEFLQANKDKLYDWIEDINNNSRTIDIIHYIKTKLFELAPQRGNHRKEIDDFFDIPHLSRKLSNGLLDVAEMLEFSLGKMKQLCAPVRDHEIDSLLRQFSSNSLELRAIFIGTVQLIDKMTFDMINFLTQTIKPHVIHNVVEYEQSCLSSDWFFGERDCRILQSTVGDSDWASLCPKKKIALCYIAIFRGPSFEASSLLSILEFDRERIERLFGAMQQFSVIAAISIILKSQLGILQETSKPSLLNSLAPELSSGARTEHSPILTATMELVHRQTQDEDLTNCIRRVCSRIINRRDTLYELLHERMLDFCRKQFDYGRFSIQNSGYEAFQREIRRQVIEPFERIFLTNYNIYSAHFGQFFSVQHRRA